MRNHTLNQATGVQFHAVKQSVVLSSTSN